MKSFQMHVSQVSLYAGFQVSFEKPQKPQKPQIRLYFFRGPQKIFQNPQNPK